MEYILFIHNEHRRALADCGDINTKTDAKLGYIYATMGIEMICRIHGIESIDHGNIQIHIDSYGKFDFSLGQQMLDVLFSQYYKCSLIINRRHAGDANVGPKFHISISFR